ncbi:MAG TPA: flagellar export protein FliJ [Phycisphaerae bacterium]|nr:flagellar export protein FliJ [Phycisphaerae bacterium]HOI56039.1 flagellar export protein FliJ [Phycisphaerae bacterium]
MAKFRLQPVLTLRKYREQLRQRDLAVALGEEQRRKDAVLRLADLRREQTDVFRGQQQTGPLDMQAVVAQRQYLGLLGREIGFRLRGVAQAERETARRRGDMTDAMQDRKAVEILEDRFRQRLRRDEDRREMAELDEVSLRIVAAGPKVDA